MNEHFRPVASEHAKSVETAFFERSVNSAAAVRGLDRQ